MKTDRSFGIIPVYTDTKGTHHFLVVQHSAKHWAFPKGHAEEGETELETAKRELVEETSISDCEIVPNSRLEESYIISEDIVSNHKQAGKEINKTVVYFIGTVKDQHVDITDTHGEIQNYVWLSYEDALKKITFPEAKEILTKAFNYITTQSL